ncbi:MAG TPA: hypothetical protein VFD73_17770, partial [Gemmatimonadales bacterium]|nr:hypothetical protein [Gemmatimonadales bacterium]
MRSSSSVGTKTSPFQIAHPNGWTVRKARGTSVIAGWLGRPATTVRGWLRAFTRRAEQVRLVFTALAASLVTDPPLPGP